MAGAEWRRRWRGRSGACVRVEGPACDCDCDCDDEDAKGDVGSLVMSIMVSVSPPPISASLSERSEGVAKVDINPESVCISVMSCGGGDDSKSSSSSPMPSSSVSSRKGSMKGCLRSGGLDGSFHDQPRLAQSCFQMDVSFERARHRRLTRLHWRRLFQGRKEKMCKATSGGSSCTKGRGLDQPCITMEQTGTGIVAGFRNTRMF